MLVVFFMGIRPFLVHQTPVGITMDALYYRSECLTFFDRKDTQEETKSQQHMQ